VRTILENPGRAAQLGGNGRDLVASRWSWETVAHQVESVYRDVIRRRSDGALPSRFRPRVARQASLGEFEQQQAADA
jgi:hypothetical protein